nr:polysaccharide pyruvyl transferase family protein [Salinicoccus roseus]
MIIFGVGAMKDYNTFDKYLYSNALNKVDKIYMWDHESINILYEIFNKNATYVPDVAYCINNFYSIESETQKCNRDEVLIGLTDYNRYKKYNNDKSEKEYYKEWEELILSYYNKENKIKLFYTTKSDFKEAIKMQRTIMNKYNIEIEIVEAKCLDELVQVLAQAKVVLSPRMHALIIAFVFGAEVIPYVMSDEIKVFKEHYLDESVSIDKLQAEIKLRLLEAIN